MWLTSRYSDLMNFYSGVTWCSDGDSAFLPQGRTLNESVDQSSALFPDGRPTWTKVLEFFSGIEFQMKEETQPPPDPVARRLSGGRLQIDVEGKRLESCASPLDIILSFPPTKLIKSTKWFKNLSPAEQKRVVDEWIDSSRGWRVPREYLPGYLRDQRNLTALEQVYGYLLKQVADRGPGYLLGILLDDVDSATDVCVDSWSPLIRFTLRPDGSASAELARSGDGLLLDETERQPVRTT